MAFLTEFLKKEQTTREQLGDYIYDACVKAYGEMSRLQVGEGLEVISLDNINAAVFFKSNYILSVNLKLIK